MANNIISAVFSSSNVTYTKPAYQYDYGMILKFSGIELPQAYEVHFSNTEFCGESISQIGDESGVTIPDEMFLSGNPIYAWTYLHTGEDDGETVYKAVIGVNKRAKPSDLEPTPVQQDAITQAIAALNVAVEQTAADVVAADASAQAAAGSATEASGYAEDAKGYAERAESAESEAEGYATRAETACTDAESARDDAVQAKNDAVSAKNDAQTYASNASSFASDAQASSEASYENARSSAQYASDASGYASSAYESAQNASGSASNASSAKDLAVQAKGDAISAKNDAVSAKNDAISAKNDAVSAKESAEEFASDASDSASEAQGYASDAQTSAEQAQESAEYVETALIDKADVITSTASGSIVTIADGGKDMPVVDLKLSLLPIQSGSGDPSPDNVRPISGWTGVEVYHAGENLFDGVPLEQGTINGSGQTVASDYRVRFARTMQLKAGTYKIFTKPVLYGMIRVYSNVYVPAESVTAWTLMDGYSFTLTSDRGVKLTLAYDDVEEIAIVPSDVETVCASANGATIPISWQSTAGTVYGGSLDLTTGVLNVTHKIAKVGNNNWGYADGVIRTTSLFTLGRHPWCCCDTYKTTTANPVNAPDMSINFGSNYWDSNNRIFVKDSRYTSGTKFKEEMAGVEFVIWSRFPSTYQLTPIQLSTFLGANNFWSNGNGSLDLEYRCDTKLYIEQLTKPTEDDMTANANITSGSFFMVGNRLMLSTTAIAQGEQIVVGTNCTEVSLADALNTINS